jgi:hypothetical protein
LLLRRGTAVQFRQQVVVATPNATENQMLAAWLEAEGFESLPRATPKSAAETIAAQPFDLLIVDAGFAVNGVRGYGLARFRDTPVLVIGNAAENPSLAPLGSQIMFLERPLDRAVFVCMVTMALMEARAERRSPRRTVKPFEATINGVQSHIIDVSREGVRLELPRDRRMVTPAFVMRVPLMGVGVSVQRMWVRVPRPDENLGVMWCGGQLQRNTVLAEQAWHRFIDTLASVNQPGN